MAKSARLLREKEAAESALARAMEAMPTDAERDDIGMAFDVADLSDPSNMHENECWTWLQRLDAFRASQTKDSSTNGNGAGRVAEHGVPRAVEIRGPSGVSHAEAREILQRFVDGAFGNPGEKPRFTIPADPRRDDDLRLLQYIDEQERDAALTVRGEGGDDA